MGSLCLNQAGDGLAITDKGKTAAELMVFARYVMFSEVYWHHGVRAATAMLQRAFYLLHGALDLDALFRMTEHELIAELAARGRQRARPANCSRGLFGPTRQLYKRLAQYSFFEQPRALPAAGPAAVSLAGGLSPSSSPRWPARRWAASWRRTRSCSTPRRSRAKCRFDVEIHFPKEDRYRPLGEVSPVVRTLATRAVRRLREAGPHLRPSPPGGRPAALTNLPELLDEAIRRTE